MILYFRKECYCEEDKKICSRKLVVFIKYSDCYIFI